MNIFQQIAKIRNLDLPDSMIDEALADLREFYEKEELAKLKKHKKRYIKYLEAKIQELEEKE